ncbi:MAG: hypothetical protein Q8M88_11735 [Phenylobacterium sp.]|uniref:hypothetical protein n=1 Tax=Phenylobacterium sp. TaxID=1871053 RepID=UPI0027350ACA|nr:hypothetical protein [Phenylobacterium sp.]MDP3175093.1 hypothetical protein [Phenylobacterium sp.]
MGERQNFGNRVAIGRAIRLRREIDEFEQRWPAPNSSEETTPAFSWVQLERQLVDLAATEMQAEMARHLVSATRKLSAFKPPEMVLREILCLTWVLLDENFRPGIGEGSDEMT